MGSGAFAEYLKDARSVHEARLRCVGLALAPARGADFPRGLSYLIGIVLLLVIAGAVWVILWHG